jgi:hypothetical protein
MDLTILSVFLIRTRLSMLNKQKARALAALSKERRDLLDADALGELPDNDLRCIYMTWNDERLRPMRGTIIDCISSYPSILDI